MRRRSLRPAPARMRAGGLLAILGLTVLVQSACSIGPWRISIPGRATQQPALVLRRCDQARDVLCVLSFGLEPPEQMLIVLLASPGLPSDLEARAAWNEGTGVYPCEPTNSDATILVCTGPLISLGSSVHIDVTAADGKTLIASGDFVLVAFALPTLFAGAVLPATDSVTITPRSTRTPGGPVGTPTQAPGTSQPTSTQAVGTPRPTQTRPPGTPYPNPTP